MKTLLLILFPLLLILFACENEEAVEPLENNFHVSGKVSNAIGQTISIIKPSKNGNELIASARIKSDGSFAIDGNIPELEKYIMKIGNEEKNSVPLALNIKDHLKINTSLETFSYSLNASGTEWSSTMNEYLTLRHEFEIKMDAIAKEQESLSEEEFTIKLIDSKQKIEEFSRDKIKITPESPYNIILSMELIPVNGFENWNLENLKCLEIMVTGYQNKYGDTPISRSVASKYEQFSAGYEQYKAVENGTITAPDFKFLPPEGKPISLSSLKGKVVLIDFWASWCGPCRKENPKLVKLYEKYKDKGFTILSVSLDNNEAAWKGAIEADGLIWPNHACDLKGWESTMTKVYGFNSIPHTVLVNKEGKINGIGLRGEALEEKIKSILKI